MEPFSDMSLREFFENRRFFYGLTTPIGLETQLEYLVGLVDTVLGLNDSTRGESNGNLPKTSNFRVLLYGPPGTGKSLLTLNVANYFEAKARENSIPYEIIVVPHSNSSYPFLPNSIERVQSGEARGLIIFPTFDFLEGFFHSLYDTGFYRMQDEYERVKPEHPISVYKRLIPFFVEDNQNTNYLLIAESKQRDSLSEDSLRNYLSPLYVGYLRDLSHFFSLVDVFFGFLYYLGVPKEEVHKSFKPFIGQVDGRYIQWVAQNIEQELLYNAARRYLLRHPWRYPFDFFKVLLANDKSLYDRLSIQEIVPIIRKDPNTPKIALRELSSHLTLVPIKSVLVNFSRFLHK